jgi:hypothetical protein
MALKDNNQIVQQFAMVNVEQFNKIFVVGKIWRIAWRNTMCYCVPRVSR